MSLILGVGVKYTRHIKELTPERTAKLLNAAMVSGGLLTANYWKETALWKSGTYRRAIHVAGHPDLTPDFEGEVIPAPRDPLMVIVGLDIQEPPYPIYLEYGTSRMEAKPRAGPALDATAKAVLKEVGEAFEKLLEQDAL